MVVYGIALRSHIKRPWFEYCASGSKFPGKKYQARPLGEFLSLANLKLVTVFHWSGINQVVGA